MVHRFLAAFTVAALSACGGGGGGGAADVVAAAAASSVSADSATASGPALAAQPPVAVSTSGSGMHSVQAIDPLASGGWAIAWLAQDASGSTLFVQGFDAQGTKTGAPARIDYAIAAQESPAIAVLRDGTVLVASVQQRPDWTVFVRRFGTAGSPRGTDIVVASQAQDAAGATSRHSLAQPVLAALDDGGFAVGWASVTQDASGPVFAQHAQRFDAGGRAAGSPIDFAAAGTDRNVSLRLVAAPGGNVVAGTTHRFNGIGYLQFRVGATTVGPLNDANAGLPEFNTTLLPLADGRYALWSTGSGGGFRQMLDATGRPLGPASSVAVVPETAVTLADGGWATVTRQLRGQPFLAQRFDVAGNAVGARVELANGIARPLGAVTVSGGFALGWTAATGQGDTDVATQRVEAH